MSGDRADDLKTLLRSSAQGQAMPSRNTKSEYVVPEDPSQAEGWVTGRGQGLDIIDCLGGQGPLAHLEFPNAASGGKGREVRVLP